MNKKVIIGVVVIVIIVAIIFAIGVMNGKKDKKEDLAVEKESFKIMYSNTDVSPRKEFSKTSISEEAAISEIPSCAFEGTDNVYTYKDLEITTAKVNSKETIYSVLLLNDEISTTEGVKISDEKSKMLEVYGNNYEEQGAKCTYTKGDVQLSFIVENDVITSIEYTYDIANSK